MTDLVARIVTSLRQHHDQLAATVLQLSEDQLTQQSGSAEWTIADTLSHLGSGAEISRATISASLDAGAEMPDNQAIWDRWNSPSPREQADDFVAQDQALVELLEGFGADQRAAMKVDLGFLPEPVTLEVAGGMRLNEVAVHAWDVAVGLDPAAALDAEAAELLLDLYAGPLAFLFGFSSKSDQVAEPVEIQVGERAIVIGETVTITTSSTPDATFTGSAEAAVRLIAGRLGPEQTPAGVEVTGAVTLDDLRKVFPGY